MTDDANHNPRADKDDVAWKAQTAADERAIANLLEQSQDGASGGLKLDDTPFDQTNKADDAEDFEDISDDDLPDEEPSAGTSMELPGLTDDGGTSNDADDLFGDGPSSPMDPTLGPSSPAPHLRDAEVGDDTQPMDSGLSFSGLNFDPEPHLVGANQDPDIPAPAETAEDLVKATWPDFQKGLVLKWSNLLPGKKAIWKEKKPSKKPKQLVTSKLSLDLATDQEKLFRVPGPATSTRKARLQEAEARGLVQCGLELLGGPDDAVQFDIDQESDSETVAGYSLRDIELACVDYDAHIVLVETEFQARQSAEQEKQSIRRPVEEQDDEWDAEFLMDIPEDSQARPKKRKAIRLGLPDIPRYAAPSFDNFQEATRRGAKRVHLDLSDPHLLLETNESTRAAKRPRQETKLKRMANGNLGQDVSQRFNISNDEAYEALKENHQSKVRATLGNISVEHSMPAIKLSWPYYKVKLGGTTDEYHRPHLRTKKFTSHVIKFDKPLHHKRKQMKGKAHEVFLESKDLSINDNSTAVLFEYCERRPRVLSNFGMGNRLINYYRRKDSNDEEQLPKQELGEYRMLLPEDRSPFSLFGTVDSGETVPTLHNEMYRAPVFKHNPRPNDFLVVRSTTGEAGSRWYLHKIDHLHVVGQQFPSVEVPGPHSRKVTNASKNRMKMLAFRMIRHSKTDNCQLSDITKHIADSTDTQNRQKLKEFLQYDRDSGEKGMWRLKPNEILPDESSVRSMIKPEEVSLLDAMQLGIKELEDAGYDPRNANIDDDAQVQEVEGEEEEPDDEGSKVAKGPKKIPEKQEETLADKMAPWKTTKAFIDACAQKAMLQLHGEGDPTGHGLGFSLIRTSMKGGYLETVQGPLATSADAMEREKRANGGHAYNVKKQQAMYEEGIREIWEKQKSTLSDRQEHDDKDVAVTEDEDDRFNVQSAVTPAMFDEGASQISGLTSSSRHPKRAIRINREVRLPDGTTVMRPELVHDPVVISQYMKRRTEADLEMREYVHPSKSTTLIRADRRRTTSRAASKTEPNKCYGAGFNAGLRLSRNSIYSSRPTGNSDHDRLASIRIKKELERLEKNKARRQAREQQKELHQKASTGGDAGSPKASGAEKVPTGTTRKCANCGQVGHIKTNKNCQPRVENVDKRGRKRKRRSILPQLLRKSDQEARRKAEALAKQRRASDKQNATAARGAAKKRKEEERLEQLQQQQEDRAAQGRLKEELQRKARERREKEKIDRQRREERKRLCPLLNGTMKADNGAAEHGGFGNYNAPSGNAGSPI
ncbi:hypothetical protein G7046_g5653 [Stylonectria norvegica]|nr:hypothetical protein G7046_g5653 [Stylonectria norvegica]